MSAVVFATPSVRRGILAVLFLLGLYANIMAGYATASYAYAYEMLSVTHGGRYSENSMVVAGQMSLVNFKTVLACCFGVAFTTGVLAMVVGLIDPMLVRLRYPDSRPWRIKGVGYEPDLAVMVQGFLLMTGAFGFYFYLWGDIPFV